MLPRVRINYANGTLGQVAAMADGCLGMMALGAKEVTGDDKFKLGKAYTLRKLADLEALGVTSENNPNLYRNVKEFYAEAGDGTELWLTGYAESETFANAFDKDNAAGAVALLKASNGKIRGLVAFKTPAEAYELTTTEGLDADVFAALPKAQQLGDWATDTLRAPIFSLVEGYGYAGDPATLKDLTETEYNRAGVVLGDTAASSKNAAMGVVAGRIATSAVQRKISRVRDGALQPLTFYVGAEPAELADLETINDKGYIHLPHVRRQGRVFHHRRQPGHDARGRLPRADQPPCHRQGVPHRLRAAGRVAQRRGSGLEVRHSGSRLVLDRRSRRRAGHRDADDRTGQLGQRSVGFVRYGRGVQDRLRPEHSGHFAGKDRAARQAQRICKVYRRGAWVQNRIK